MNELTSFLICCIPGAIVVGVYYTMMYPNWLDNLLEKPAEFIMKLADKYREKG